MVAKVSKPLVAVAAAPHRALLPPGWPRPKGYANGIVAQGRMVFTAGVVGWDENGVFAGEKLSDQLRKTLENIVAILAEADAGPEHVVRMTWYITSRDEYHEQLATIGAHYREIMGRNYPTMAVLEVSSLMEPVAKVEIEATAVVPF
jgi:enamine deaminase RidA (YjgF/YER057c/UK114 family)